MKKLIALFAIVVCLNALAEHPRGTKARRFCQAVKSRIVLYKQSEGVSGSAEVQLDSKFASAIAALNRYNIHDAKEELEAVSATTAAEVVVKAKALLEFERLGY